MQILIAVLLILIFIGFIIYKTNGQFGKKESIIFIAVVLVCAIVLTMYQKNQKAFLPNAFKQEYKKSKNLEIIKLSYELLNNKNIASKKNFIYKFTYIVKKQNKEFLCTANNVKIQKIEDEFIFGQWTEECQEK